MDDKKTNSPIGAWKVKLPHFHEIMTDQPFQDYKLKICGRRQQHVDDKKTNSPIGAWKVKLPLFYIPYFVAARLFGEHKLLKMEHLKKECQIGS